MYFPAQNYIVQIDSSVSPKAYKDYALTESIEWENLYEDDLYVTIDFVDTGGNPVNDNPMMTSYIILNKLIY